MISIALVFVFGVLEWRRGAAAPLAGVLGEVVAPRRRPLPLVRLLRSAHAAGDRHSKGAA
jgi:hypothetical protein